MEKIIRIKSSSSDEIYSVVFKNEKDLISLNCNCKAGLFDTLCKHRLCLIERDYKDVLDKDEAILLYDIIVKNNKSEIIESVIEVNRLETEIKKLGTKKSKLKKDIGFKLSNGF